MAAEFSRGARWILIGVLAACGMLALALGVGSHIAHAKGAAAVDIVDFAFQPATIEVPEGTKIRWTNDGEADHTVTADDGAFSSGTLSPGASFSASFDTAGTFTYHCDIHPQVMKGTIVVTPAETSTVADVGVGTAVPGYGAGLALLAGIVAGVCALASLLSSRRA